MNRSIDPWLILSTAALIVLGLVMVYSASAVVAAEQTGNEMRYFTRQLIAVGAGLVLCAATAITPTRVMRRYRAVFYVACIVGLALCFVPGISYKANGAARWLGFGSVHVQPSEFSKIAVVIMLAHFLDRWRGHLGDWRVLLRACLIPLPIMALILPEPDFGTTAIVGGICALMLFVAGLPVKYMAGVAFSGIAVGMPLMLLESYRIRRLTSFLDPWASQKGEGYHIIQSWVAMHSGGLWGQGLGNSMAKLHFLPEPWTDFIAAVIAEELGLLRLLMMVGLFGIFVWRGLYIARRARDAFGMFLASTITAMVGFEAFFNMAVVMGMVPPKGLVLPFISYGATAMMSHLWAVGILLSIAAEADTAPEELGWPHRKRKGPTHLLTPDPAPA